MTALPKRKPARRTTMAEPGPATDNCVLCGEPVPPPVLPPFRDDYRACADITACTSRMPRTGNAPDGDPVSMGANGPVIFTPASREKDAADSHQLRADWGADGIRAFNDASEAKARQATFGPCTHPLLRRAARGHRRPDMMP